MPVTPDALARHNAAYLAWQAAIQTLADEARDNTVTILVTPAGRSALVKVEGSHRVLPIDAEVSPG